MKKQSLFLATSVMAGLAIGVSPSAARANPGDEPGHPFNPTPTDIPHAAEACASLRADSTDEGVKRATGHLMWDYNYGRDGATQVLRYATVVMCPDMSAAVAQEWDNRQRLRFDNPESWDAMWARVGG